MLAQRNPIVTIDAIEIEKKSAGQAASNIQLSKYSERIAIQEVSFQKFYTAQESPHYDLIACNPPYFSSSLRADSAERTLARHDDALPLDVLFEGVSVIMNLEGRFALILPAEMFSKAEELAKKHSMYLIRALRVKPTPEKQVC